MIETKSIPFLSNTVTEDRSWIITFNSETKHQSSKWHTNMSPPKKKPQVRKSQQKVMLIIVFNSMGVVCCEFALSGSEFCFLCQSLEVLQGCHLVESYPITGLDRLSGLLAVEAPRISRQSAHEGGKVFCPTHWPPLPPRRYSWYSSRPQSYSAAGRIKSMKKPNDPIGNRICYFPACFAVPQRTAPPYSPICWKRPRKFKK
jgi:hypothetical protein